MQLHELIAQCESVELCVVQGDADAVLAEVKANPTHPEIDRRMLIECRFVHILARTSQRQAAAASWSLDEAVANIAKQLRL